MNNINITIPNLPKFLAALRAYPQIVAPKIQDALSISIEEIQRSTVPLTPRKIGTLRLSLGENKDVKPLRATIGSHLDYAVVQHENMSFKHSAGGAKYLERGVEQASVKIKDAFAKKINEAFNDIARRSN